MTVDELLEALLDANPHARVVIDGCDCSADASGVFIEGDTGHVVISNAQVEYWHADEVRLA